MMRSPLKLARCTQTTQECVIYTLQDAHVILVPFSQSFNDLVERQQRSLQSMPHCAVSRDFSCLSNSIIKTLLKGNKSEYWCPLSEMTEKKLWNVDLVDQKFLLIPNLRYLSFSMLAVLNNFFLCSFFRLLHIWLGLTASLDFYCNCHVIQVNLNFQMHVWFTLPVVCPWM